MNGRDGFGKEGEGELSAPSKTKILHTGLQGPPQFLLNRAPTFLNLALVESTVNWHSQKNTNLLAIVTVNFKS